MVGVYFLSMGLLELALIRYAIGPQKEPHYSKPFCERTTPIEWLETHSFFNIDFF